MALIAESALMMDSSMTIVSDIYPSAPGISPHYRGTIAQFQVLFSFATPEADLNIYPGYSLTLCRIMNSYGLAFGFSRKCGNHLHTGID